MTNYIIKCNGCSCDNFGWETFLESYGEYFITLGDNRFPIQTSNEEAENTLTVFDCIEWYDFPENIEEVMADMCIKVNGNRYAFYKAIMQGKCNRETLADLLTFKTGHKWVHSVIRGSSQSEWTSIVYREDKINNELLQILTDFFFNDIIEVGVIEETDKNVDNISCDDIEYFEQIPLCKSGSNTEIKEYLNIIGDVTFLKEKERTVTYYEKEVI